MRPNFLHIQVHQLTRPLTLVANDGAGRAIEASKDGKTLASEDAVNGGGCHAELIGDAMWSGAQLPAQGTDRLNHGLPEGVVEALSAARTVPQAFGPFFAEALPPLRDGAP